MSQAALLDSIAQASGLSPIFARQAISRACKRSGVDPAELTPAGVRQALPEIERGIRGFHDTNSLAEAMARIKQLCR